MAVSLLKHTQYLQDTAGTDISLHYIRTKDGKELDFSLSQKGELTHLIEVKLSDQAASRNLIYFKNRHPGIKALQLVHNARTDQEADGIAIVRAANWLAQLSA